MAVEPWVQFTAKVAVDTAVTVDTAMEDMEDMADTVMEDMVDTEDMGLMAVWVDQEDAGVIRALLRAGNSVLDKWLFKKRIHILIMILRHIQILLYLTT